MTNQWTSKTVREELPFVRVRVAKRRIIDCRVTGRLNDFASVSPLDPHINYCGLPMFPTWSFAWDTIANSLNNGKPLQI